jgi:hypothetical protein
MPVIVLISTEVPMISEPGSFGGLGPADSQVDERVRTYMTDNVKLTTNIEYRIPFNDMYEGAFLQI